LTRWVFTLANSSYLKLKKDEPFFEPELSPKLLTFLKVRSALSWNRNLRITSHDKQASMHASRFGTQFEQSSKHLY